MKKLFNNPKEDTWMDVVLLVLMVVFTDSPQAVPAQRFSANPSGATNS